MFLHSHCIQLEAEPLPWSFRGSNRFCSVIGLYLALSIFPSTLTRFPVEDVRDGVFIVMCTESSENLLPHVYRSPFPSQPVQTGGHVLLGLLLCNSLPEFERCNEFSVKCLRFGIFLFNFSTFFLAGLLYFFGLHDGVRSLMLFNKLHCYTQVDFIY